MTTGRQIAPPPKRAVGLTAVPFAAPIHLMKRAISFGLTMAGLLCLLAGPAQAELDIVLSNAETEEPIYVLRNTETGKVLGTFWDRANETSDYGFESSVVPDFLWSPDRAFVAVMGGAPRSRGVSLYQVSATSLKPIPVPELTDEQARVLLAIPDVSAEGTDAVRWEEDGTLLLHSWAQGRVTSDTEEPKTADVWAVLEITGDSSTIVSTSSTEPEGPAAEEDSFDASRLAGVHQAIGRNPDGSSYKGTVKIEVTDGLVELEWKIAGAVSHGKGALVGMTLGVALDSGLALYRLVPQAEGQSLIGIWSTAGSTTHGDDAIVIANADITEAEFPVEEHNGEYLSLREVEDGQVEGNATISGGEKLKQVSWTVGEKTTKCQALALGEGLAVLTPSGLSVFEKHIDNEGNASLVGLSMTSDGAFQSETLSPQ